MAFFTEFYYTFYIIELKLFLFRWTEDELSSLSWNYMQCSVLSDAIGELVKMFREDGIIKSRDSVIKELLKQNLIDKETFDRFMKGENERSSKSIQKNMEKRDDEITKLCEQLAQDGKLKFLEWVQNVLLDTCSAKLYVEKRSKLSRKDCASSKMDFLLQNMKKKFDELPILSPVSYHSFCKFAVTNLF